VIKAAYQRNRKIEMQIQLYGMKLPKGSSVLGSPRALFAETLCWRHETVMKHSTLGVRIHIFIFISMISIHWVHGLIRELNLV
jgi:hypothetical protein